MLLVLVLRLSVCRAPYGARGLKLHDRDVNEDGTRRAPYGARGLKFMMLLRRLSHILSSRPVWGAWIEILFW